MKNPKSPAEFGFKWYDKGRLQKCLHQIADKRTYLRLQSVLLVAKGMTVGTVAKIIDKSVQIIYRSGLTPILKLMIQHPFMMRPERGVPLLLKALQRPASSGS